MPMQPFGDLQLPQMSPVVSQIANAQPRKGGMFAGADWSSALQALIGGALASRGNPGGMALMQMLNQKRQQAFEESKYQSHRKDNLADYAEQQKLQAQYGTPPAPHYFETNSGDQMMIGSDGNPQEVFHDPMRYKFVPNGMGGVVPVDISALMGGGQKPVGKITPIEGGPAPQGPGGFRY